MKLATCYSLLHGLILLSFGLSYFHAEQYLPVGKIKIWTMDTSEL